MESLVERGDGEDLERRRRANWLSISDRARSAEAWADLDEAVGRYRARREAGQ
jgi:hypothetical protein